MTEQQLLLGEHMELSEQHIHQHRERQAAPGSGGGGLAIPLPHKAGERDGLNGALLCSTNVCVQPPPPRPVSRGCYRCPTSAGTVEGPKKRDGSISRTQTPGSGASVPPVVAPQPSTE